MYNGSSIVGTVRLPPNHGDYGTGLYRQNGSIYGDSNQRKKRDRPPNTGSVLLRNDENQILYALLGNDCISLAAGVVQLLRGENRTWRKLHVGVISLVKDYNKRFYVLRYKNFRANSNHTTLLTFEGDTHVIGLNFASHDEARDFRHHLDKRYEQEQKSGGSKF